MHLKIKLVVETHFHNNIFVLVKEGKIPEDEVFECPKIKSYKLLEELTGYTNLEEDGWIKTELVDTEYDEASKTVYILYVCRVPEKMELKQSLEWVELSKIKDQIERIKGLF